MKKDMPLEGLRWSRDSGSALYDTPQTAVLGRAGGVIHVYFLHYQSFEEGVSAWKRRVRRIQWNNIFVVLSEKDGCTKMCLEEFEHLSYESKVALTHVEYPDITCGFYVKGYENCNELGNIMDFKGFWGQKVYDQFDWVKFLNQK